MAFTEEQEKIILEFVAKQTTGNTNSSVDKSTQDQGDKDKKDADDSDKLKIAQQVKDQLEVEKAAASALTQIQQSIKFNLSVSDFVEKNKTLLPDEANKILAAISAKTFKDDNEKANIVRKSLLDSFLSQQENIDCLIPGLKSRADQYKSLAESEKEKRSSEFWDLAEVGIALKAGARKAKTLNEINGVNAGEDSKNIIGSKILTLAKERFKPVTL